MEVFEAIVQNNYQPRPGPLSVQVHLFLSIDILACNDGYRVVVNICSEPFPCSIASFAICTYIGEHYVTAYLSMVHLQ